MDCGIVEIEIDGHKVTVDTETYNMILTDPEYAQQYINMITDINNVSASPGASSNNLEQTCSSESRPTQIWKSSKNQTTIDNEATLTFLSLRKQYAAEFEDKKTKKNIIWDKIAKTMNEMGYFVGDGLEGREKCRQKFANLQTTYFKTLDRRRQTGEGKVNNPPYFEEMQEIFGDSHKANPVLIVDSNVNTEQTIQEACESNVRNIENQTPQSIASTSNRFANVKKTVRPTRKNEIVESLKEINKENLENRKEEFSKLVNLINKQNEQRHQQMMQLIAQIGKKKRKRQDSSDSSD